jgi:predicted phosphodiesterase
MSLPITRNTQGYIIYTQELLNALHRELRGLNIHEAWRILRKELNVGKRQARRLYADHFRDTEDMRKIKPHVDNHTDEPSIPPSGPKLVSEYQDETGVAESVGEDVKTLDDLLRLCEVDLDIWEVERYVVNKWAVASKNGGGGGMTVQPLWQVKAWLKRKTTELRINLLLDEFVRQAKEHAPVRFNYLKRDRPSDNEKLVEISVPDLHLAKLCWAKETNNRDYDIKIAANDFREANYSLFARAKALGITRVLLPIGNDIFNSDNLQGTTTAGTPQAQSEDSRWQKTFSVGCDLVKEIVERLACEFPVDVVIVAGNHDKERCYYLGQFLSAWFHNHPNVTVDNAPSVRKYYSFGNVLLGFDHGHETKHSELALTMGVEKPAEWAHATCKEWHIGHTHTESVKEYKGIKVRVLPSLCPPDEWMTSKGFVGNVQTAQAFIYDAEDGLEAILYSKPVN